MLNLKGKVTLVVWCWSRETDWRTHWSGSCGLYLSQSLRICGTREGSITHQITVAGVYVYSPSRKRTLFHCSPWVGVFVRVDFFQFFSFYRSPRKKITLSRLRNRKWLCLTARIRNWIGKKRMHGSRTFLQDLKCNCPLKSCWNIAHDPLENIERVENGSLFSLDFLPDYLLPETQCYALFKSLYWFLGHSGNTLEFPDYLICHGPVTRIQSYCKVWKKLMNMNCYTGGGLGFSLIIRRRRQSADYSSSVQMRKCNWHCSSDLEINLLGRKQRDLETKVSSLLNLTKLHLSQNALHPSFRMTWAWVWICLCSSVVWHGLETCPHVRWGFAYVVTGDILSRQRMVFVFSVISGVSLGIGLRCNWWGWFVQRRMTMGEWPLYTCSVSEALDFCDRRWTCLPSAIRLDARPYHICSQTNGPLMEQLVPSRTQEGILRFGVIILAKFCVGGVLSAE